MLEMNTDQTSFDRYASRYKKLKDRNESVFYVTVVNKECAIPLEFISRSFTVGASSEEHAVNEAKFIYALRYLENHFKRKLCRESDYDKDLIKTQLRKYKQSNLLSIVEIQEI